MLYFAYIFSSPTEKKFPKDKECYMFCLIGIFISLTYHELNK